MWSRHVLHTHETVVGHLQFNRRRDRMMLLWGHQKQGHPQRILPCFGFSRGQERQCLICLKAFQWIQAKSISGPGKLGGQVTYSLGLCDDDAFYLFLQKQQIAGTHGLEEAQTAPLRESPRSPFSPGTTDTPVCCPRPHPRSGPQTTQTRSCHDFPPPNTWSGREMP
jgi:hypothetical protein